MKFIRWILSKILLTLDAVFSPKVIPREEALIHRINEGMKNLSLYQFEACPFCIKVRRYLKTESVNIDLRDAKIEPYRSELLEHGGRLQVPCLRVEDAQGIRWIYESDDIIAYLRAHIVSQIG